MNTIMMNMIMMSMIMTYLLSNDFAGVIVVVIIIKYY